MLLLAGACVGGKVSGLDAQEVCERVETPPRSADDPGVWLFYCGPGNAESLREVQDCDTLPVSWWTFDDMDGACTSCGVSTMCSETQGVCSLDGRIVPVYSYTCGPIPYM